MPFNTNGYHPSEPGEKPTEEQIQKAHDVLSMVIESGMAGQSAPVIDGSINSARDTLCWVLGHPGDAFDKNLDILIEALEGLQGNGRTN